MYDFHLLEFTARFSFHFLSNTVYGVGARLVLVSSAGSYRESKSILTPSDRSVLVSSICICCGAKAFLSTRRNLIPRGLRTFHGDLTTVASDPELYAVLAIAGVVLYVYAKTVLSFIMKDDVNNKDTAFFTAQSWSYL